MTATPSYRGGSGEPLVLVHGGGGTWRQWEPAIPHLEATHDLLAPTLPGHHGGPRTAPGGPVDIDTLTDGVAAAMDGAGWQTAHVAGTSLGTWVAFELAKRGRARTVVALAPLGPWEPGERSFRAVALLYRAMRLAVPLVARKPEPWCTRPRLRRLLAWHHFAHPERIAPEHFRSTILGFAGCTIVTPLVAWAAEHGGPRDLDRVGCPVLLAFPERDRILAKARYAPALLKAIDGAQAIDLPDVGHVSMSDDPALVARVIARFANGA